MGGEQGAADLQRRAGVPACNALLCSSLRLQHCGEEPPWERVFQGPAVLSSFDDGDLSSQTEPGQQTPDNMDLIIVVLVVYIFL